MAYLIFTTARGRELGRRAVKGPTVIGRSPDCEVCVHDILLSRWHCRVEPQGRGWQLTDLASKNGTFINGREIGRHVLSDGDAVRIGKTVMTFCVGVLTSSRGGAAMKKPNKGRPRPTDPFEALSATVSGFDYVKSLEQRNERLGAKKRMSDIPPQVPGALEPSTRHSRPTPQPVPLDPAAYQKDDVYSLLTDLVSSSWDSIYMNASRPAPTRPAPRPIVLSSRHPRHRGGGSVDLSLQVTPNTPQPTPLPPPRKAKRWRRTLLGVARGLAAIGQSVMVLGIVHLLG